MLTVGVSSLFAVAAGFDLVLAWLDSYAAHLSTWGTTSAASLRVPWVAGVPDVIALALPATLSHQAAAVIRLVTWLALAGCLGRAIRTRLRGSWRWGQTQQPDTGLAQWFQAFSEIGDRVVLPTQVHVRHWPMLDDMAGAIERMAADPDTSTEQLADARDLLWLTAQRAHAYACLTTRFSLQHDATPLHGDAGQAYTTVAALDEAIHAAASELRCVDGRYEIAWARALLAAAGSRSA